MLGTSGKRLLIALIVLLAIVRVAAAFAGQAATWWHLDLRTLASEQERFYAHVYPHAAVAPAPANLPAVRSDYPPYSFPLLSVLLPPELPFGAIEFWFAACQMIAGAIVLRFIWRSGKDGGRGLSVLLCVSFLSMTGLGADILFGNIALIMTAALVAMHEAVACGRPGWAAAAWVGSVTKPQMGWLFSLLLATRARWRALAMALVTLAALTLVTCAWTGVSPVRILFSSGYVDDLTSIASLAERNSLVSLLIVAGVPVGIALPLCALAALGVGVWALANPLAHVELLGRMAFLSLLNRTFAYHNYCDDLLLVFALIWLGERAWRDLRRRDWLLFLALGISVWTPTRFAETLPMRILAVACWLGVAAWIAIVCSDRVSSNRDISRAEGA